MRKSTCIVTIDGRDVSSNLLPSLINLSVTDKAGSSSDTCNIELDDTDGVLLLPRDGVSIEVSLGDNLNGVATVFRGTVDEVRSSGSRSGGMVLSVTAKGVDTKGKAKQPQQKHWDKKPLGDVLTEAGKEAGIPEVTVDPALKALVRDYWAMQNESFLHFGERIAREVGGTFKVSGQKAVLAKRNGGTSASGEALPPVTAAWGRNLISWDISPTLGRPRYKSIKSRYYDTKTATWKEKEVQIDDPDAKADYTLRNPAADETEADTATKSGKADSERAKGGGSITIDGDVSAQPEADLFLTGARPGIDGQYRIDSVTHEYSRGSGFTTRLEVKQPQGSAGKDTRG